MSVSPLKFFHDSLPVGSATLYTVPAGLSVVLHRIWVANATGAGLAATLSAGGKPLLTGELIAANRHLNEPLEMLLVAGDTIAGSAGGAGLTALLTGFTF